MTTRVAYLLTAALCFLTLTMSAQTTWTGASDNDWNTAANWSNGLPAAGNNASIPASSSPVLSLTANAVLDYAVDNAGALTFELNGFNLNNGNSLTNSGTLSITGAGAFSNLNEINNSGTFSSASVFTNSAPGTITNSASFELNSTGINFGEIENTDGTWTINADFDNGNTIDNQIGASFVVNSNFDNTGGSSFVNAGQLSNESAGFWSNFGALENSGTLQNSGIFLNDGAGVLQNLTGGTITNSNRFTNQSTIDNQAAFENADCATFTAQNNSSSSNTNGGSFINEGILYQLGNAAIDITSDNGVTFTDQGDFPAPTANCLPNLSIELDADGNYTLTAAEIDNGSSAAYCPITSSTLSQENFTCADIGQQTISLTVRDGFDTPATCETLVEINDNTAPTLNCPADIIANLSPGDCNAPIVYTVTAEDNCDYSLSQTDNSGLSSGSVFPNGTTVQTYEATDGINTVDCSFTIEVTGAEVPGALTCNNQLNISIDEDCSFTFTANIMLTGADVCESNYSITINDVAITDIDETFIGQNLMVSVENIETGNSCWGNALIEDKLPPVIENCQDTILNCLQNSAPISEGGLVEEPSFSDCSEYTSFYIDSVENGDCDDDFARIITRTWTATDVFGFSSTCTQVITVELFDLDLYPPVCPPDYSEECTPGLTPDISPATTDYPTISIGADTYVLTEEFDELCGIGVDFEDSDLGACDGSVHIMRTWLIYNWCEPLGTATNPITCTQLINITDNTGPVITTPADFTVSVGEDCTAIFNIPPATAEDCSSEITWKTQYSLGQINNNGGPVAAPGLTIGTETVTYLATDACGNTSTATLTITIIDDVPPTAVCDGDIVVTLSNGFGQVNATSFDLGSTDNCCIDSILIARMEDNCGNPDDLLFDEQITFCCADVGQETMAILRVVDCYGNANECMAPVTVEDKIDPNIVCPPDKTIECDEDPTDFGVTGEAVGNDNCGEVTITFEDNTMLSCQGGVVIRTFTATDNFNNSATCAQTITVLAPELLSEDDIMCPDNYEVSGCTPNTDPSITGEPVVDAPDCVEVVIDFTDEVFPGVGSYCQKITRTWTIVDPCIYNGNPANGGYFECIQTIFVSNSDAPTLSCPSDLEFCNTNGNCFAEDVDLTITYSDDCTPVEDLQVFWIVDINNDGVTDTGAAASGVGLNTSNNYPVGTHEITYTVKDVCGTAGTCSFLFTVNDCGTPAITCPPGINIELMQNSSVPLFASQIDLSSANNGCSSIDDLQVSFSTDVNDTLLVYSCADVGPSMPLSIFVTNSAGNQGSCQTTIGVQDNMNVCPSTLMIAGEVTTEWGQTVDEVMIAIEGEEMVETMTDEVGHYEYAQGNPGQNYNLTPHSNEDWMNGVTTWDVVLIRRHVLNTEPLNSPYALIAADVNNSGTVTTADALALRSMILQLNESFPNNTAWRYVDANYAFPEPTNPWLESFPEAVNLPALSADEMSNNFIAVKVGDLNGTVVTNGFSGNAEERTGPSFRLNVKEQKLQKDQEIEVVFSSADLMKMYAYQMTLNFDKDVLNFLSLQEGVGHQRNNFGLKLLDEGALTCSWDKTLFNTSNTNTILFSVRFQVKAAASLSKVLNISSRFTPAVAYDELGQEHKVELQFTDDSGATHVAENFILYQNRPNPFRNSTAIGFDLPKSETVRLRVFDGSGNVWYTSEQDAEAGYNEIILEAGNLPKGLLYYELSTGTQQAVKKMLLTR